MDNKQMGERLKVLRERAEMTQAQVSKAISMNEPAYSFMEKGKSTLKITRMLQLCELYNLTPDTFLYDGKPINEDVKAQVIDQVSAILGPAFDSVEEFNKLAVQLRVVLRAGAALKHGLDQVGIKTRPPKRKYP